MPLAFTQADVITEKINADICVGAVTARRSGGNHDAYACFNLHVQLQADQHMYIHERAGSADDSAVITESDTRGGTMPVKDIPTC